MPDTRQFQLYILILTKREETEFRSCVKVEVAVLGSPS